jgi:hypothetical protein
MQSKGNETVGQFLMDLAIIGFAKCGTTTMSKFGIYILLPGRMEDLAVL